MVGQLAALLVPGAGHSEDAEVVQDAAAALQQCSSHDSWSRGGRHRSWYTAEWIGNTDTGMLGWTMDTQLGGTMWNIAGVTSGLSTTRAVNEPPIRFSGRRSRRSQ